MLSLQTSSELKEDEVIDPLTVQSMHDKHKLLTCVIEVQYVHSRTLLGEQG